MNNYFDYHLHLEQGPYTMEWLEEFLKVAHSRGVREVGFTEHAYRFREAASILENNWARQHATQSAEDYVRLLSQAKTIYPEVRLGLEVDYVPGKEEITRRFLAAYPFDFVLGSVHFLGDWGFDNPEFLAEWDHRDVDEVYRYYFWTLRQAATSRLFDVLAHPDVIKVFGHRATRDLTAVYRETVETIARSDLAIEVSSAGLRKPVGELYPAETFLQMAFGAGIPITTASDAHRPEDAGRDLDQVVVLARRAGYTAVSSFQLRQRISVSLDC